MSGYIETYIGLLKLQALFMKSGVATFREHLFIPVRDAAEFDSARSAFRRKRTSKVARLPAGSGLVAADMFGVLSQDKEKTIQAVPIPRIVDLHETKLPALPSNSRRCERPYYIRVPVSSISVQRDAAEALSGLRQKLQAALKRAGHSTEIFWSAGLRRGGGATKITGIDAQIDIAKSADVNISDDIQQLIEQATGVPTSLELGMSASTVSKDKWANKRWEQVKPGLSISAKDGACTVTAIVRRAGGGGRRDHPWFALSVGHGLLPGQFKRDRAAKLHVPLEVHQPAGARGPDDVIGTVAGGSYTPVHDAEIEFDAGLVLLSPERNGPNSIGKYGCIVRQVDRRPEDGTDVFFYGATSGWSEAAVRREDVAVEISARDIGGNSIRLYMFGLLEIVKRERDDRNVHLARPGDSGAPVVVRRDGNYSLVGYIVAAGTRNSEKRHPRTYAAPADVLFDSLEIELV